MVLLFFFFSLVQYFFPPRPVLSVSRGAIGKMALTGLKKPQSNLMKPKHRTIGKKPVASAVVKMTEKKLAAILQSTDFPAMGDDDEDDDDQEEEAEENNKKPTLDNALITMTREPKIAVKPVEEEAAKENHLTASKSSKIKVPRVYNKDSNIKPKPLNVSTTTSMTGLRNRGAAALVRTKAPPAEVLPKFPIMPKSEAATGNAYKIVKGVRMNRRFELMMKHRNNKTAAEKK